MKKVFLIAPTHMNLYKDIVDELKRQEYDVEFLALKVFPHDPFFVFETKNKYRDKDKFLAILEKYWVDLFNSGTYSFNYDYVIVINGSAVHPVLFSLLKQKNPRVKCINYLFDSTQNTYRFDRNFACYDKIYTFDTRDAADFKLNFLPIYWTPIKKERDIDVDVFGFGAFSRGRYDVFSKVKKSVEKLHLSSFIKLYIPKEKFIFKAWLRDIIDLFKKSKSTYSYSDYKSDMVTHSTMSPDLFRQYIVNSNIIIDTSNPGQVGLTARFMWALGAGKKIVTNNKSVIGYSFYNKNQFFVLGNDQDESLESFLSGKSFIMEDSNRAIIDQWRIDNWVRTLLKDI